MSKKTDDEVKPDEPARSVPLSVDSAEREGNDVPTLLGSGAPMVQVVANTNILGLQAGQKGIFLQSEELRLQAQQGLLSIVSE